MVILIVLFFSIVTASALCSMSEAAILSLPLMRARIFNEQKKRNAKHLLYIKENINEVVSSIAFANNFINIIGSMYIGEQIALIFGNKWLGAASAVMSFSIIIGGEIIPKTIGERYKVPISLSLARPLRLLHLFFHPLVVTIFKILRVFVKKSKRPTVTEEEIKMMLKLGRTEGTVEMDEEVLCSRVFKLNDVRAAQIMKPIDEIFSLPANRQLGDVKDAIIDSRFSRIAVYDEQRLNIVGTVQQRVLLREIAKDNYTAYVRDFMSEPIFVNWFAKADDLLEKFQAYHQHLFIARDSRGKVVGLVTMEDVLEELFGEIFDEKDAPAKRLKINEPPPVPLKLDDPKITGRHNE